MKKFLLMVFLVCFIFATTARSLKDDNQGLAHRVKALEDKVAELEAKIADLAGQQGATKTVYRFTIDPEAPGDVITAFYNAEQLWEYHYVKISLEEVTLIEPPVIQILHNIPTIIARVENYPLDTKIYADNDTSAHRPLFCVKEGEILVLYKRVSYWDSDRYTYFLMIPDSDGSIRFSLIIIK